MRHRITHVVPTWEMFREFMADDLNIFVCYHQSKSVILHKPLLDYGECLMCLATEQERCNECFKWQNRYTGVGSTQLNSTQLKDVYCNKIIVILRITQRLKPIWVYLPHCLTLVRLLTLPKTLFVNWCGSTKIFRSHLKMCSNSRDSLSILTKSCVR